MSNTVDAEKEAYAENSSNLDYNGKTNEEGHSDEEKANLESELSTSNIDARVITWAGKYLKVKFYRDNKPFTIYKNRQGDVSGAKEWLKDALQRDKDATS